VLNAMLAPEHLCNGIEANTETAPNTAPILEHLACATIVAGIALDKSGGCVAFVDQVLVE
jgi:hypothetical protein